MKSFPDFRDIFEMIEKTNFEKLRTDPWQEYQRQCLALLNELLNRYILLRPQCFQQEYLENYKAFDVVQSNRLTFECVSYKIEYDFLHVVAVDEYLPGLFLVICD